MHKRVRLAEDIGNVAGFLALQSPYSNCSNGTSSVVTW